MISLARARLLTTTASRLLAPTSVVSQQDRFASKAVVFNMGGSIVPSMSPVISRFAQRTGITEAELTNKLFVEGDAALIAEIEPSILSRNGSHKANLAHVLTAIQSIRGEGLKTALVNNDTGLNANLIPVDMGLFDSVVAELKPDIAGQLKAAPSDVVYLDNCEANLAAAAKLGFTTVNVGDVEAALTELEGHLQVPLKEWVPGFTWIFYDSANSPHKSAGETVLFYSIVILLYIWVGEYVMKNVLMIGGH